MEPITISASINAPRDIVWKFWNEPAHIKEWAFASEDWECPYSVNDLQVGGVFVSTVAAQDGSSSFDFSGTYTTITPEKLIEYTMSDGRNVKTMFEEQEDGVHITQTFDPETENPRDMQQQGWQAILNNFKKHVEENKSAI